MYCFCSSWSEGSGSLGRDDCLRRPSAIVCVRRRGVCVTGRHLQEGRLQHDRKEGVYFVRHVPILAQEQRYVRSLDWLKSCSSCPDDNFHITRVKFALSVTAFHVYGLCRCHLVLCGIYYIALSSYSWYDLRPGYNVCEAYNSGSLPVCVQLFIRRFPVRWRRSTYSLLSYMYYTIVTIVLLEYLVLHSSPLFLFRAVSSSERAQRRGRHVGGTSGDRQTASSLAARVPTPRLVEAPLQIQGDSPWHHYSSG